MKWATIWIVARKELTDGFRDRRAIYTVLMSALFGPLIIAFTFNQLAVHERAAQEITIPIVGQHNGPVLVEWLAQQPGVEVSAAAGDAEELVRNRKNDFVLIIDKDFSGKFRSSRAASVKLVSDSTRETSEPAVRRVRKLLTLFNAEMGALRLIAHGVSPTVGSAIAVEDVEISSAAQRAGRLFGFIPMFLIGAAFTAGMQIATDATAGERERFSLEALLINPVPRWQLVAGKWLAAGVAALAGTVATLAVTAFVLSRLSLEDLGVRFRLGLPECALLMAALFPMCFIAPAMQVYLSCFAKSFKEAQSYMAFLVIAAFIPGVIAPFYPLTDKPWLKPIPIIGQYALAIDILGGKVSSPLFFVGAGVMSLLFAGIFLWLAARLFSSERIILGR